MPFVEISMVMLSNQGIPCGCYAHGNCQHVALASASFRFVTLEFPWWKISPAPRNERLPERRGVLRYSGRVQVDHSRSACSEALYELLFPSVGRTPRAPGAGTLREMDQTCTRREYRQYPRDVRGRLSISRRQAKSSTMEIPMGHEPNDAKASATCWQFPVRVHPQMVVPWFEGGHDHRIFQQRACAFRSHRAVTSL